MATDLGPVRATWNFFLYIMVLNCRFIMFKADLLYFSIPKCKHMIRLMEIRQKCRDFWIFLCYNFVACFYTTNIPVLSAPCCMKPLDQRKNVQRLLAGGKKKSWASKSASNPSYWPHIVFQLYHGVSLSLSLLFLFC